MNNMNIDKNTGAITFKTTKKEEIKLEERREIKEIKERLCKIESIFLEINISLIKNNSVQVLKWMKTFLII